MRSITPTLINEYGDPPDYIHPSKLNPIKINTYIDLVKIVARVSYLHKDYLIFFRGQNRDFMNKGGSSTYYPSIYRGEKLSKIELELRFDILNSAASRLVEEFENKSIQGYREVKKRKYIQWSILQHYEVCQTPLLDFTHSLRVACSIAFLYSNGGDSFISIFGLPYITNRISINSEHDIVNVRLLSICPPDAIRPYFQDGYLAGTDEITTNYDSKTELDFSNRLLAKFKINNNAKFWEKKFDRIPNDYLFPQNDAVLNICKHIKSDLGTIHDPGRIGKFLQIWTEIENNIMSLARFRHKKVYTFLEALTYLGTDNILSHNVVNKLDKIRIFRNKVVHFPKNLSSQEINQYTELANDIRMQINNQKFKSL